MDIHTHYYTPAFFQKVSDSGGQFSFGTVAGQTIITYNGARFFGITAPMTDVAKRIEDMDRVSGLTSKSFPLSTPNDASSRMRRASRDVAKLMNQTPTRT